VATQRRPTRIAVSQPEINPFSPFLNTINQDLCPASRLYYFDVSRETFRRGSPHRGDPRRAVDQAVRRVAAGAPRRGPRSKDVRRGVRSGKGATPRTRTWTTDAPLRTHGLGGGLISPGKECAT
jgi:hypothetical protein